MTPPFWPPRARKTAETAHFGPSAGKTESTAATPPKFRSFYPLELFGLIHKRPGQDPFFAKNQFSPTDEFVFMGLVVRSCHFDVTACAEARRLAQRAERPLRGLSALWASRRASRAGWTNRRFYQVGVGFICRQGPLWIRDSNTDNCQISPKLGK